MIIRLFAASHVMPFGAPSELSDTTSVGPPSPCTLYSLFRPVSVTYTVPVASAATSLRKPRSSPEKSTFTSLSPVRRLKPRTASASATHSVSPTMYIPRGACSTTRFVPPAMNFRFSIWPSGFIRLM